MVTTPLSPIRRRSRGRVPTLVVAALLLAGCSSSPDGSKPTKFIVQRPAPSAPPTTSPTGAPVGGTVGLAVNESAIPRDAVGHSTRRIGTASHSKSAGDGTASFRVNCSFAKMRFDDPIVAPGRPRASHLHTFFGNTSADAMSTPESIRTSGNSTCSGGTINRSAYWAPAVIDANSGTPQISNDPNNIYVGLSFLQVYYKTGYEGVAPGSIQNFPTGLRMIAGSATSTGPQPTNVVHYGCTGAGGPEIGGRSSFPSCAPGQTFIMSIDFPQCWDGVNLDAPDHKSHMAYGIPGRGCPATHPVPLAKITQNYRYLVPAGGMASWRLSSDMYQGPAGYSGHADWMNGWDPAVFQRVIDNCYKGAFDCSMNLLGDGQELLN